MANERSEPSDEIEMAAAELVARVKAEQLPEIEVPILEESNVWEVKVKKLSIRPDDDLPDGGK